MDDRLVILIGPTQDVADETLRTVERVLQLTTAELVPQEQGLIRFQLNTFACGKCGWQFSQAEHCLDMLNALLGGTETDDDLCAKVLVELKAFTEASLLSHQRTHGIGGTLQ